MRVEMKRGETFWYIDLDASNENEARAQAELHARDLAVQGANHPGDELFVFNRVLTEEELGEQELMKWIDSELAVEESKHEMDERISALRVERSKR